MNKKGQLNVGGYVLLIIVIIVVVNLLLASAQGTDKVINSRTYTNYSATAPASAGGYIVLPGQNLLSTPIVFNATTYPDSGNETANSSVFSSGENVSEAGEAQIYLKLNSYSTWAGKTLYVTYDYGEAGYANDSAARTMLELVIIMSTVALIVWIASSSGLLDWLGRD